MTGARSKHADAGTGPKPVFHYLDASVPSSLFRNGNVSLRRAPDGTDSDVVGYVPDARRVMLTDARALAAAPTLDRQGFACVPYALPADPIDFLRHDAVIRRYYPECVALVKGATGAAHVFAFDHNVRWAEGQRAKQTIAGGQQVQGPVRMVHGDYTLTSAPQRLRDLAAPPRVNDTLRPFLDEGATLIPRELAEPALAGGRFAFVNVWRNIHEQPVQRDPLAFVDAQTVRPDDFVVFEIHYEDRSGENYFAHHSPAHRWYFYSRLERTEAVLIKQWDSAGALARSRGERGDAGEGPCTMNLHSAFEDPTSPEHAPDRRSIEVRCVAIYDR